MDDDSNGTNMMIFDDTIVISWLLDPLGISICIIFRSFLQFTPESNPKSGFKSKILDIFKQIHFPWTQIWWEIGL